MRKRFLSLLLLLLMAVALITLKSIAPELLNKQVLAFALGFIVFFATTLLPFSYYLYFSKYAYWALNLVLLILLLTGKVTRGITAWITLPFGFKFQPSQLAVPITALYLSSFFANKDWFKPKEKLSWRQIFELLSIVILPAALIILEPDFGTAVVFLAAMSIFFLMNRLGFKKVLTFSSLGFIALVILWTTVLKDYQRARLLDFLTFQDPSTSRVVINQEETSASYNARQALIAVGSGQFWGQGLGLGTQSHLKFLPERQTDFIFASFAQEWGFVGSAFLLALYFFLLAFMLYSSYSEEDFAKQLYTISIFSMFLVQILINVGMNLAILPITGITLPFLSYGGSSVISLFMALGIFQRILNEKQKRAIKTFQ